MNKNGTVVEFGTSQSGKPKVKILEDGQRDAQWYSLGTTDMSGVIVGERISFEPNSSNFRGNTIWFVGNYGKIPVTMDGVHAVGPTFTVPPPVTIPPAPGIGGPAPNTMTEGERAFVSNVCAHAIDGGLIKAHTDLSSWVKAAVEALRHFDDAIPY